jgi:hypothetical protein
MFADLDNITERCVKNISWFVHIYSVLRQKKYYPCDLYICNAITNVDINIVY